MEGIIIWNWFVDVVGYLLSSSVIAGAIGGGLALAGRLYFKRYDFKHDYYKKIIDKRLNAYEKLEAFIGEMSKIQDAVILDKDGEKEVSRFEILSAFANEKNVEKTNNHCLIILENSLWYSSDIVENLKSINEKLIQALELLNKPIPITEKDIVKYQLTDWVGKEDRYLANYIGRELNESIINELKAVGKALFKDLSTIYKADDFLNINKI